MRDTGVGIAAEDRDAVFEEFRQVGRDQARKAEGTGLGLPLARKIASQVGLAELVLLERKDGSWVTLAAGELSLQAIARAEAWLSVPGENSPSMRRAR